MTFLQWALPRLRLRWPGFRKVRRQVCKRLSRRLRELGLGELQAYQVYLGNHPAEWQVLDGLCRITISRFYRDRAVFVALEREVLPVLARQALARGEEELRAWSAGCASGEEPYTLALLWRFVLAERFPELGLGILATDADPLLLERALDARYPEGSLRDLPTSWRVQAFERIGDTFQLRPAYRAAVTFLRQDIRRETPDGPFDLVLCRNLAFTYFEDDLQRETLSRLQAILVPGGALVLGAHESLPEGTRCDAGWRIEPGGSSAVRPDPRQSSGS